MRGVGCRVGYTLLAGTCIRLASEEKSHGDALTACQEEGATLAMPKTEELDVVLRDLVKTEGGNEDHWIGGMKTHTRATWQWVDGSQLAQSYQGWSPNEPNIVGYEGNAICAQYWSGGVGYPMWDDTDCHVSKRYICQVHPA
ncbi:CD209 antigen-like [Branchiostoma lanceolatum]|uniref:CD209 antigen-like n=1 Tax=Branchiostoma lanceolatum TaxID=7740 RepID=UPI0034545C35